MKTRLARLYFLNGKRVSRRDILTKAGDLEGRTIRSRMTAARILEENGHRVEMMTVEKFIPP